MLPVSFFTSIGLFQRTFQQGREKKREREGGERGGGGGGGGGGAWLRGYIYFPEKNPGIFSFVTLPLENKLSYPFHGKESYLFHGNSLNSVYNMLHYRNEQKFLV